MGFRGAGLTSQQFCHQMNAVPVKELALLEQKLVSEVVDQNSQLPLA